MDRFDYLIVGAGFAGSVCAERLASAGQSVLLIDQRAHIGGNAYDEVDAAGILVHRYGAHIFHTNATEVFAYLSRFTAWRPYEHRVQTCVDGTLLPFPINRTTLAHFQGDLALAKGILLTPYTIKQWGRHARDLDASVLARVKPRDSDDDRYFTDTYQAMPLTGYTALFERLLAHPLITVRLNTLLTGAFLADAAARDGTDWASRHVIYTGPIDEYFDYRLGTLPYRSARFTFQTHPGQWQPVGVVNYPQSWTAWTRIAEFKHLTGQQHPLTTIAFEYPTDSGEPYWPVPTRASAALAESYRALAAHTPGVSFCGRLGTYRYLNMDQVVAQALKLSAALLTGVPDAHAVVQ